MSSDAEREAEERYPHDDTVDMPPIVRLERISRTWGKREGWVDRAEWERSRPVSEAEIAVAAHVLWQADDSEMETSWLSNRDHYMMMARNVLEAAAKVRAQGGTE